MSVRIITIVVDRTTGASRRTLAWIPGVTQPTVDQLSWIRRSHPPEATESPDGASTHQGWRYSNQPAYGESRIWRHPPPSFEFPEGEPAFRVSLGRLLGPQPSYTENTSWRHPPVVFEFPEGEPAFRVSWSRFLGPQPSYAESTSWRRKAQLFEPIENEVSGFLGAGRFLGPQPGRGEQLPWRRQNTPPSSEEGTDAKPRTWFAALTTPVQVTVDHLPWRRLPSVTAEPELTPGGPRKWFPGMVNQTQVVIENMPWKHPPPDVSKIEGEPASQVSLGRILGPQPSYGEQLPWRHPRVEFEIPEEPEPLTRGWYNYLAGGSTPNLPAQRDVRFGVTYGPTPPSPNDVRAGVVY